MNSLRFRFAKLLRRSERYTKVDMVYLASGTFWSAFGTVASGLVALGTAVAFANLLPKETYGTYQYVISVLGLLGILGLPGIKTAISYASSRGNDGSFFDAVHARIRWSFLSSLGALAIAAYYVLQDNLTLGGAFFILAAFLPWWDVYGSYVPYLQGKRRFGAMTVFELGAQVANAAALLLVMVFTDNLLVLLGAYFLSWTVARYCLYRRALALVPPNDAREPGLLSYGKHLSLMSVISTAASNADKLLLWHFLGPVQVAVYTFALTVPGRAVGAFASINRLYFPKVAAQTLSVIRGAIFHRLLMLGTVTLASAVGYVLIAPYFFHLFFPEYMDAVPYTQLASLLIALQPFSLLATALSAHARKKELYIYNVLPPLVQIALLVLLIPHFHILGALIAVISAQVLEAALLVALFLKASRSSSI